MSPDSQRPLSGRSARRRTLTDREVRDLLYPSGDVKATPVLAPITVRASDLHLLRETAAPDRTHFSDCHRQGPRR